MFKVLSFSVRYYIDDFFPIKRSSSKLISEEDLFVLFPLKPQFALGNEGLLIKVTSFDSFN